MLPMYFLSLRAASTPSTNLECFTFYEETIKTNQQQIHDDTPLWKFEESQMISNPNCRKRQWSARVLEYFKPTDLVGVNNVHYLIFQIFVEHIDRNLRSFFDQIQLGLLLGRNDITDCYADINLLIKRLINLLINVLYEFCISQNLCTYSILYINKRFGGVSARLTFWKFSPLMAFFQASTKGPENTSLAKMPIVLPFRLPLMASISLVKLAESSFWKVWNIQNL